MVARPVALRALSLSLAAAALSASFSLAPRAADACGGCFHRPPAAVETQQVVSDHRMVMAVHPTEAILWDQFRYRGRAEDFVWVLPVFGDVRVELASSEFFDRLDDATAVQVRGLRLEAVCPSARSSGGGFGCGAGRASSGGDFGRFGDGGASSSDSGVTVLGEEVVGPYQTVRLRSTDTMALTEWLRMNDYVIPRSIEPIIESYTRLRMDFVALRLRPGEGVQSIQPVRVRYRSANMVLPLRMVAAGVGDKVGISLWVFGAGRYEAANFLNGRVREDDLSWSWDTNASDYRAVWERTLRGLDGGRAWITEGAYPAANVESAVRSGPSTSGPPWARDSGAWWLDAAEGDGGGDGDGGAPVSAADDWDLATDGLGSNAWVTRLRTDLLARFLDADLTLQSAVDVAEVSRTLTVRREAGARPAVPCAGGVWRVIDADGATVESGRPTEPVAPGTCAVASVEAPASRTRWHGALLGLGALGLAGSALGARRRARR